MTNEKVVGYFLKHKLPMPPRSVCNGCFANRLDYFAEMYQQARAGDSQDWEQAVAVDESIRDWSGIGVKRPVFIHKSCTPLRELAAKGFQLDGQPDNEDGCDSGYCIT